MYLQTSSNNNGDNVFCSFERTDNIQMSNITFYYNRFLADGTKAMGRFRIQLLDNNTWSTQYNKPKNDRYSDTSTDWTLVSVNFSVENYGFKLIYDQIDTPHADMCFSNITKKSFCKPKYLYSCTYHIISRIVKLNKVTCKNAHIIRYKYTYNCINSGKV